MANNTATIDFAFSKKQHNETLGSFDGYLSVFDNIDGGRDVVHKGAFTKSIKLAEDKGRKIPILWQHNTNQPIGIFTALEEDEFGLRVKGQLEMEVQQAREANALLKSGALTGMSIGYNATKKDYDRAKNIRNLREINLKEGSLVTFPMNDDSRILKSEIASIRDLENCLRDAGFSRLQAKGIAAHGFSGIELRDADVDALNNRADEFLASLYNGQ